jgi:hypothetical protein
MKHMVYAGRFGDLDWHEWVASIAGLKVKVAGGGTEAGAASFHFELTEDIGRSGFATPELARDAAEAKLRELYAALGEMVEPWITDRDPPDPASPMCDEWYLCAWDDTADVGRPLKKGAPPWFAVERLVFLADECVAFARKHKVTHVWIEGLPTHGGQFFASGQLEQVGGAVRYALWSEVRLVANTVPLNSGRKTVMGKLPRSDVKRIVHETIRSFSQLSDWTGDELDAWVAANHGVSLLGGCAVVGQEA